MGAVWLGGLPPSVRAWLGLVVMLAGLGAGLACQPSNVASGNGAPGVAGRLVLSVSGELSLVNTSQGTAESLKRGSQAGGDAIDPAWSPDGRELAYIQQTLPRPNDPVPLGQTILRALNPSTGEDRVIREEPSGALLHRPAWAPDGQSLYYTRVEHHFEGQRYLGYQEMIMRIGRDGQNPAEVVRDGVSPAPSPDGAQLAFLAHEGSPREPGLWRLDLATGATRLLLAAPAPVEINGPAYAPDGRTIAIAASALASGATWKTSRLFWEPSTAFAHGLPADVWLINPDGSDLRQLTKLGEDRFLPAWSPDGQSIAALGQGGLFIFGLDGTQRTRFERLGGEGSVAWGRSP